MSCTIKKCHASLSLLYPIKHSLTLDSRNTLVNALVLSKIRYCMIVWFDDSKQMRKKLDKVFRTLARFVLKRRKYDSITHDYNNTLNWLNAKYLFRYELAKFCFKSKNDECPANLNQYLVTNSPITRTTRRKSYSAPNIVNKTKWGEKSTRTVASQVWLDLPETVTSSPNFNVFKTKVFNHFLTIQREEAVE